MGTRRQRGLRALAVSLALSGGLIVSSLGVGEATQPTLPAFSLGNTEQGVMSFTLRRGALVPPEFMVYTTPDCDGELRVQINWNEDRNKVRLRVWGRNAVHPHPNLDRTPGVDYFPNPFFPEPEDITDGRYQLWIIMQGTPATFYYSGQTLDLLGSDFDFPTPPPQSIPIRIPTAYLVPTDFIEPNEHGDIDFVQEWDFDEMVRGDLPEYGHLASTFVPPSLCVANPFRVDLSTLRPYASDPVPADQALTWADFLEGGLMLDFTLEPATYHRYPPLATNVGVLSALPMMGGEIPPGWSTNFKDILGNTAPPIRPFPGRDSCEPYFEPQQIGPTNNCSGPPPGPPPAAP